MNYILFVFIFSLILFFYIHIFYHLKISKDLEVYSVVNPTKNKLEEICGIRQPVIFTLDEPILDYIDIDFIQQRYGAFDLNINSYDKKEDNTLEYSDNIPVIFDEALEFLKMDGNKAFISIHNKDFLTETTLMKEFKKSDYFLRPQSVSVCDYDIILGSKSAITKTIYDVNFRNYFMCLDGNVTIRVVSPMYKKYMNHLANYAEMEFYSPYNIWDIQEQYRGEYNKVKTMDIILNKGDVVYIPAYWYYSIKFNNLSCLAAFKYRTYMNTVAIAPELCMYFLQNLNIKRNTFNVYDNIREINEDSPDSADRDKQTPLKPRPQAELPELL